MTKRDRQGRDGAVVMDEAVELCSFRLRLLGGVANDDEGGGQDLQMIRVATDRLHPPLDIGEDRLAVGEIAGGGKDRLRRFSGELATGVGLSGLNDDGPALRRASNVEGAANAQFLALVPEHMHAVRIEEDAAFCVVEERIIGKTVPKAGDDIVKFAGAVVALAMFHMLFETEIEGGIRIGCRDDVPAGATAADMVERGETAGDVIGQVEGRGGGGDEADPVGDGGERRKQGEGLEGGHGVAALQGFDRHVENGEVIGHEEGVEFRLFQLLREALDVLEIEVGVRVGAGITPGTGMQADGAHEGAKLQLLLFSHRLSLENRQAVLS